MKEKCLTVQNAEETDLKTCLGSTGTQGVGIKTQLALSRDERWNIKMNYSHSDRKGNRYSFSRNKFQITLETKNVKKYWSGSDMPEVDWTHLTIAESL